MSEKFHSLTVSVPGSGSLNASVVIIGEAPGENEEASGEPFAGSSGRLLDYILQLAGFGRNARDKLWLTNVIKIRPPLNNINNYVKFGQPRNGVTKVVETDEFILYKNMLHRELLQLPNLKVIIPLGKASLYSVTNKTSIYHYRGSIIPCTLPGLESCCVVPTNHPAASFRDYPLRYIIARDIEKARLQAAKDNPLYLQKTELITAPTVNDVEKYLSNSTSILTCDIESLKNSMISIGFCNNETSAICVPLLDPNKKNYSFYTTKDEIQIWELIKKALLNPDINKVFHNCMYDVSNILEWYNIPVFPYYDTLVLSRIATPEFRGTLEFLSSLYTDIPFYKDGLKEWKKVPSNIDVLWKYNALDCLVTYRILKPLIHAIKEQHNEVVCKRQTNISMPLILAQTKGVPVNQQELFKLRNQLNNEIKTIEMNALEVFGEKILLTSSTQLADYFYQSRAICNHCGQKFYLRPAKPRKRCPHCKGKTQELSDVIITNPPRHEPILRERKSAGVYSSSLTTDDEAMGVLKQKFPLQVELILQHRSKTKFKSTYLETKLHNGCVRTSFNIATVGSGRLSSSNRISSEDSGVPFQILPPNYRKLLTIPQGYLAVEVDYSMAENRCVGYFAGDKNMMRRFDNKEDLHKYTAWGVLKYGFGMDITIDQVTKQERNKLGKPPNHALNYGMSIAGFAAYAALPIEQARIVFKFYHSHYPNISKVYHPMVERLLLTTRTLENPLGRSRKFLHRMGRFIGSKESKEVLKLGWDWIPQSTVGDLMNEYGMLKVFFDESLMDVVIANQIHDGIWYFIKHNNNPWKTLQTILKVKSIMEQPILVPWNNYIFTIPVDIGIGLNYGYYSKDNPLGLSEFKGINFNNPSYINKLTDTIALLISKENLKWKTIQAKETNYHQI